MARRRGGGHRPNYSHRPEAVPSGTLPGLSQRGRPQEAPGAYHECHMRVHMACPREVQLETETLVGPNLDFAMTVPIGRPREVLGRSNFGRPRLDH